MSEHRQPPKRPLGNLAMHDFARLVAEGALPPRDRMNNPIGRGHLVVYHPAVDIIYQVMDVIPVMDPRQPGTVRLHLMATVPLTVPVNRPIAELLICGINAEAEMAKGPGAADGNSDGATADRIPDTLDESIQIAKDRAAQEPTDALADQQQPGTETPSDDDIEK